MIGRITKIEDDAYDGKDFKKVTLGDGAVLKVKQGREGSLKAKWGELEVGKTYEWTMGEFNKRPFVQDFKVTSEAPPPVPNVKPDQGMTPDLWAEKDRIKQMSIETQVAYTGIIELAKIYIEKDIASEYTPQFQPVYDAALDWAMAHFRDVKSPNRPVQQTTQKPPPEATTSTTGASKGDSDTLTNAGEFYTACFKKYGVNKTEADKEIKGYNLTTEEGRKQAWGHIVLKFGVKPDEKNTTKEDAGLDQEVLFG